MQRAYAVTVLHIHNIAARTHAALRKLVTANESMTLAGHCLERYTPCPRKNCNPVGLYVAITLVNNVEF